MLYKIIAAETGELIEWAESSAPIHAGEFVVTKVGPKKVVKVGQLERDTNTNTRGPYIPLWTR
ncbi:hypothetical protein MUP77_10335 [Candidatus Bathyarchaeota archaeon]|nr:hypothetical protein [Candidatus Bathyarchaeota archaeon]